MQNQPSTPLPPSLPGGFNGFPDATTISSNRLAYNPYLSSSIHQQPNTRHVADLYQCQRQSGLYISTPQHHEYQSSSLSGSSPPLSLQPTRPHAQIKRSNNMKSILSTPKRHKRTNPCMPFTSQNKSVTPPFGTSALGSGLRPARSYIRSWRKEVGAAAKEAADGKDQFQCVQEPSEQAQPMAVDESLPCTSEPITLSSQTEQPPVAPSLQQRGSTFSRSDSRDGATSSGSSALFNANNTPSSSSDSNLEHPRDVGSDIPLPIFAKAVTAAASATHWHCQKDDTDAIRKEALKHDRTLNKTRDDQKPPLGNATESQVCQSQGMKKMMAEKMVDNVHDLICSIWPSACGFDASRRVPVEQQGDAAAATNGLVPLRAFIREILRRSKSSCATLRCAEWYLLRIRQTLMSPSDDSSLPSLTTDSSASTDSSQDDFYHPDLNRLPNDSPLLCPRRAFLSALIVAHKFLHDRVYSNRAWAKVSNLDVKEIGRGELALATLLDWNLWVGKDVGCGGSTEDGVTGGAGGDSDHDERTWFSAVGQSVPPTMPIRREETSPTTMHDVVQVRCDGGQQDENGSERDVLGCTIKAFS